MNILNLSQTNYHIKFKSSNPEYEDDKESIGWTPEYEESFKEKLNESLQHRGHYIPY